MQHTKPQYNSSTKELTCTNPRKQPVLNPILAINPRGCIIKALVRIPLRLHLNPNNIEWMTDGSGTHPAECGNDHFEDQCTSRCSHFRLFGDRLSCVLGVVGLRRDQEELELTSSIEDGSSALLVCEC